MLAFGRLDPLEDQVSELEGTSSYILVVVVLEGLLVLGRSKELHVMCLVELVERVLASLL